MKDILTIAELAGAHLDRKCVEIEGHTMFWARAKFVVGSKMPIYILSTTPQGRERELRRRVGKAIPRQVRAAIRKEMR